MKKFIILCLVLAFSIGLVSCAGDNKQPDKTPDHGENDSNYTTSDKNEDIYAPVPHDRIDPNASVTIEKLREQLSSTGWAGVMESDISGFDATREDIQYHYGYYYDSTRTTCVFDREQLSLVKVGMNANRVYDLIGHPHADWWTTAINGDLSYDIYAYYVLDSGQILAIRYEGSDPKNVTVKSFEIAFTVEEILAISNIKK